MSPLSRLQDFPTAGSLFAAMRWPAMAFTLEMFWTPLPVWEAKSLDKSSKGKDDFLCKSG